jgi:hypothetical protein
MQLDDSEEGSAGQSGEQRGIDGPVPACHGDLVTIDPDQVEQPISV